MEKIDTNLFEFLSSSEKNMHVIVRPSVGYWQDAWNRMKRNKIAFYAMILIITLVILSIVVPLLSEYGYNENNLPSANQAPSFEHWFGTDGLGRDVFVRVFYGARYSLIIGFIAAFINIIIGVAIGSIAGFLGGKVDMLLMRIVDILYSIPLIIFVILLMTVMDGKSEILTLIISLSISYWIGMARIVRGEILQLREQEFVLAAKAQGANSSRIIIKHLIPNTVGSIIVTLTMLIPSAIFTEAFLSFIGLGLSAPKASLGTLTSEAMGSISVYPYQLLFPSLMICLIILGFNLFGDGLRDCLDPKMKK